MNDRDFEEDKILFGIPYFIRREEITFADQALALFDSLTEFFREENGDGGTRNCGPLRTGHDVDRGVTTIGKSAANSSCTILIIIVFSWNLQKCKTWEFDGLDSRARNLSTLAVSMVEEQAEPGELVCGDETELLNKQI